MSKNKRIHQDYGLRNWGDGYFLVSQQGQLLAAPHRNSKHTINLQSIVHQAQKQGLHLPLLVRFNDILHDRVNSLCAAFRSSFEQVGYRGNYTAIYPIKVNQQRTVVEELLKGGGNCIGLEAGSKAELMSVLALSRVGSTVICNGYKDSEYIRLALIGKAMGIQVYIVIEKMSELPLVIAESNRLDIAPLLGVRVRLSTSAQGNWQNSGGDKAKFGLTASQLLHFTQLLSTNGTLHWLKLLHSHIGSQIPNLTDIQRGTAEVSRYFAELIALGAQLTVVDIGGGLGVDYEGTHSRHYCSINYSLENYAQAVTKAIMRVCDDHNLPHPDIFSESGRALTAHHAVLITNVIDREVVDSSTPDKPEDIPVVQELLALLNTTRTNSSQELFHSTNDLLESARMLFEQGQIDLHAWSQCEQISNTLLVQLKKQLRPEKRRDRELLDILHERLADKLFINFSLFQSTPDVWAIDQVFPIVPLQRLNEPPTRNAILHDLTCDSDGCVSAYVDQDGIETTLPIHEHRAGETYLLGIFLVGAYQEILGDMHNLFGDTNTVNVKMHQDSYQLVQPEHGDSTEELLRYVHYDTDDMLNTYRDRLFNSSLDSSTAEQFYQELENRLGGYTYFKET